MATPLINIFRTRFTNAVLVTETMSQTVAGTQSLRGVLLACCSVHAHSQVINNIHFITGKCPAPVYMRTCISPPGTHRSVA